MPIIALLLFGGSTLQDFAFALLIGVASGAYSSIFIASPVLTHWKEREPGYRARRRRIEDDFGMVPAYAAVGADVEPAARRARRAARLSAAEGDTVSAAEFEEMKRDLGLDDETSTRTSTLTKRLAHTTETEARPARTKQRSSRASRQPTDGSEQTGRTRPAAEPKPAEPSTTRKPSEADLPKSGATEPTDVDEAVDVNASEHVSAPDVAENEGMTPTQKPKGPSKPKSRNRRHGRRR
jgi:SecD/SecF fusion protein